MSSTKPYQGKKILALGLGKYNDTNDPNIPPAAEVIAKAEQARTNMEALGFIPVILSINPKDLEETAVKPIRELIRGDYLPDVVSVGGGLRTMEPNVPAFEKLLYLIVTECAEKGKIPRFAFPYGPDRMIECVERVLADEQN